MLNSVRKSVLAVLVAVTGSALAVTGVATLPATAVANTTISIDDPAASGAVRAGALALTGRMFQGPAETTTVLFVVDATDSTSEPADQGCGDLNVDGKSDTLDCEIGAVRAMDADLAASAGSRLQVGLMAYANEAAAADLSPDGSALFVPPGYTGGDAVPRVVSAAASVKQDCRPEFGELVRNCIGKFDFRDLQGSGEAELGKAVTTALEILQTAPAGPKWVMFLSDGVVPLDRPHAVGVSPTLTALTASGVSLRSFAIGGVNNCNPDAGLAMMAAATGETCVNVQDPATLAASLQGSIPESIAGVTVTVGGVALAADVDPVGGWRVGLRIGKGTYTARATATLSSGATVKADRTFTVTDPAPGTVAPPGGSVTGTGSTLLATKVAVRRPGPSRAALPSRVTGTVRSQGKPPKAVKRLNGATVLLKGRSSAGAPWVTVGRSTVSSGDFALKWKRRHSIRTLRVELQPYHGLAASSIAVPVAPISACRKVNGVGGRWTLTCHTTARKGSLSSLLQAKRLADRAKVANGVVSVTGSGKIGRYALLVDFSRKTQVRLSL